MDIREFLINHLRFTDEKLIQKVLECADVKEYPRGKCYIDEGDPVPFMGFLMDGLFGCKSRPASPLCTAI